MDSYHGSPFKWKYKIIYAQQNFTCMGAEPRYRSDSRTLLIQILQIGALR